LAEDTAGSKIESHRWLKIPKIPRLNHIGDIAFFVV
jgi:hypothetical protein